MQTCYYDVLNVDKKATPDEIQKAYKKMAIKWHPDRHNDKDKKQAEGKFAEIAKAYKILSKESTRKQYDKWGHDMKNDLNIDMDEFHRNFAESVGAIDPNKIYSSVFGESNGFGFMDPFFEIPRQPKQKIPKKRRLISRGKDYLQLVHCTMEELYFGTKKTFRIKRKRQDGTFIIVEEEVLEVEIKPGYKDGTRVVFQEKMDKEPNKIPGDAIFIIKEIPHERFKREGDNIVMTIDVTLKEALEGFTKTLIAIDDETLNINSGPMKKSDQELAIKGYGMPMRKGGRTVGKGELIIRLSIDFTAI